MGISVSCKALVMVKLLISFKTVFLSMQEKLKLEVWWDECDIDIILGWFLYFKTAFRAGLSMFWWKLPLLHILRNFKIFNNIREKNIEAVCYFCIIWKDRFETQVPGAQMSGSRYQVRRFQVPGARFQLPTLKYQRSKKFQNFRTWFWIIV